MMLHFHRAYSIYLWLIDFVLSIYLLRFWKYMDLAFRKHSTCIFFFLFRNDLGIRVLYVQFSSVTQSCPLFVTLWTAARQASLSITNSQSLLKPMSIELVMPTHPLSFPSPPVPNPSQHQGLFQWVNSSCEVAKVLEFQRQHQSFEWIVRTNFL